MSNQTLILDSIHLTGKNSFTFSERVEYLKKFGAHSQSFSTLQPGMEYFDMPGVGYIGYMKKWGKTYVLSNPVADAQNFELIITEFQKKHSNAVYIQVSKSVVDILHRKFGLYGTQFGSESRIDLKDWSLTGKKKQILRTAINQSEKAGIVVKERYSDDHTKEISEAWIKTRKCKSNEIRFLIRPMQMSYKENERHFYAYEGGKAVGFIYFDPIYKNNEIVSYVPNISRACAEFKQGIFYTLMCHAMDVFKAEGVPSVDLGLIPLMLNDKMEEQEAKGLKRMFWLVREKGNFLYNFKGLEFTKSRFRGEIESTYCCHKSPVPLIEFIGMFKLTRVI
jgi:phosphatidylglycerol lysyltransferase